MKKKKKKLKKSISKNQNKAKKKARRRRALAICALGVNISKLKEAEPMWKLMSAHHGTEAFGAWHVTQIELDKNDKPVQGSAECFPCKTW